MGAIGKLTFKFAGTSFLAYLLIVSGLSHMQNSYAFLISVSAYGLLPPSLLIVGAAFLPALEFCTGCCLIVRVFVYGAWCIASSLFLLFFLFQLYAVTAGLQIDCGCSSPGLASNVSVVSLGRTFVLLSISGVTWYLEFKTQEPHD